MRVFIAFEVSQEAKEKLLNAQKKLQTDNAKLNLTKSFHLTLKFLGEITPARAEETRKKLETIQFQKFTAKLNGTGVFPEENHIRVVWAGIEPKDTICELQHKIDEALGEKEKDFQPHITLARVKHVKDKKQFTEHIKKLKIEPISFEVKEFKLIQSKLGSQGPEYTDLATYSAKDL
ncbi:RNA 2',3'-cyclic phosphodiesterase [Candidatus Woesearchaeota archaeon]|nr:RNA 2',3'-cyclic phosphodiesterase [Candidatus Woesearchaeota archaeon]